MNADGIRRRQSSSAGFVPPQIRRFRHAAWRRYGLILPHQTVSLSPLPPSWNGILLPEFFF